MEATAVPVKWAVEEEGLPQRASTAIRDGPPPLPASELAGFGFLSIPIDESSTPKPPAAKGGHHYMVTGRV